ncbi:MAG: nucleotidyl transferase AbiEii/AbiGii toxin family protein [Eubacterium sp.]|nr:nucleotidyl transferase AbiEii/AbiGii toxin family protein [Eubacterium sp.]
MQQEIEVIFKGGTSLSKAYGAIDRFSEDTDITFKEHLGESRRKKLKYNILKPIAEDLEIEIKNWKDIESDKNYNHYDFYYNSVSDNSNFSGLSPFVKLETALMSYSFPTERRQISNYIYDTLKNEEPELIKKYNLIPFEMSVQCINRTLADKIFAVCDYYLQGKAQRNSRHLYDIFKLLNYVEIDEEFVELMMKVREHRKTVGEKIAPAANENVDILQLAREIYDSRFYENDYHNTTENIISDEIDYSIVIERYIQVVKELFEK